jgi:signal transduction histidine kinase
MRWVLYIRLITLTAGTLLPFFWMMVILGHRRQRNFERVFFFLCLGLTCFFGSSLLGLNAELFYVAPPSGLLRFAWTFLCIGFWAAPGLLLNLQAEYASMQGLFKQSRWKTFWLAAAYLPTFALLPTLFAALKLRGGFEFDSPTSHLGSGFRVWLPFAAALATYWEVRFAQTATDAQQKLFHKVNAGCLGLLFLGLGGLFFWAPMAETPLVGLVYTSLLIAAVVPLGLLIGNVERFSFLQFARQRNLMFAVFGIFVALLYLSFVRRAGQWLETYLPPEATAALLLFLPVVFFEPLQRVVRGMLRQTAQSEVDRAQKLMGPINEVARLGDSEELKRFAEKWIGKQLQLAKVHLSLDSASHSGELAESRRGGAEEQFEVRRGRQHIATLMVRPYGAMISGETFTALELVCEQLPASFDLCRLIEEKVQLERELAERERLALVGQMAASISHNLKNPLGSMKTILQVQLESPELPESLRGETEMVLAEINRLSTKLNQLLQFSRPGTHSGGLQDRCEVSQVAENVASVFRHEAEQRGIALELKVEGQPLEVQTSAEVTNDILSNLLLNAVEAVPRGGRVRVLISRSNGHCRAEVEDNGPGVPVGLKEKILQPFFTTKARGTGLGLAIVARRVEEVGGKLEVESPVRGGRGSRFVVTLPLETKESKS